MSKRIEIRRGSKIFQCIFFPLDIPVIDESFINDSIQAIIDTIQSIFENSAGTYGYQLIYTVIRAVFI